MKDNTKYKLKKVSMDELLNSIDPTLTDRIRSMKKQRTLATMLTRLRIEAGLTQADMARLMGCTQSRISKLETCENDKLTLWDIIQYSQITGQHTIQGELEEDKHLTLSLALS